MSRAARLVVALSTCAAAVAISAAPAAAVDDLAAVRAATAQYHQQADVLDAGYGELADLAGLTCIESSNGSAAMGVHYVNGALVVDGAVDTAAPEALIYEPMKNGRLRLVGLEYVVFQAAWDATHEDPPSLFGQEFGTVAAGNRYGIPPSYALHVWLWKHNPDGMFADYNVRVSCPD